MIICQYDINSDNFDLDTLSKSMNMLQNSLPNETIIAVPSGLSIAFFSDEDGVAELENIYRFLGENIVRLKETIKKKDKDINDTIRYMDICSTSPYYQNAWETIKKNYGIEKE